MSSFINQVTRLAPLDQSMPALCDNNTPTTAIAQKAKKTKKKNKKKIKLPKGKDPAEFLDSNRSSPLNDDISSKLTLSGSLATPQSYYSMEDNEKKRSLQTPIVSETTVSKLDFKLPPERQGDLFDELDHTIIMSEETFDKMILEPSLPNGSSDVETSRGIRQVLGTGSKKDVVPAGPLGVRTTYGHVGLYRAHGDVHVVEQGRWRLNPNPFNKKTWITHNQPIGDEFSHSHVHKIHIGEVQLGKATFNGKPVFMMAGIYLIKDATFKFVEKVNVFQPHIQHEDIHILRVPRGNVAKVTHATKKLLLGEGVYRVKSNEFIFHSMHPLDTPVIEHGINHIYRVQKGCVALVSINERPYFLKEGVHRIDAISARYEGHQTLNQVSIINGTQTFFRVRKGEIALLYDQGQPRMETHVGYHYADSKTFEFVRIANASDRLIELGPLKRVMVSEGEVGVMYVEGRLEILSPGIFFFDRSEDIFYGHLSLKQHSLALNKGRPLDCEDRDLQHINIESAVIFKICRPEKVLGMIRKESRKSIDEKVKETVHSMAVSAIQTIMLESSLKDFLGLSHEKASSKKKSKGKDGADSSPSSPSDHFVASLLSKFRNVMEKKLNEQYGIEVIDVQISNFELQEKELAGKIAAMAIERTEKEAKKTLLAANRHIEIEEAELSAARKLIAYENEAKKTWTKAEAAARAEERTAEMNARKEEIAAASRKKIAQLEAESLRIETEARAHAIRSEALAKAEAERAQAEARAHAILKEGEARAAAEELLIKVKEQDAKVLADHPVMADIQFSADQKDALIEGLGKNNKITVLPFLPGQEENPALSMYKLQFGRKLAAEMVKEDVGV